MVGVHGSHDSSTCYNPKLKTTSIHYSIPFEFFVKNKPLLSYRIQQFKLAVWPPSQAVDTSLILPYLTPAQLVLFRRLQKSEQWHALTVLQKLVEAGQKNKDVLTAALLHDIGKIHYPLKVWERVLIVLLKRVAPRLVTRWGQEQPQGLSKPFVVACQHPGWGADLAARTGASKLTVDLIRRHEEPVDENGTSRTDRFLRLMQQADNSS